MAQSSTSTTWSIVRIFFNLCIAILALVVILILAFPIGFYGMAMYISPSLPNLDELKQAKLAMPLQIYTQDNQLIGQYGNTLSLPITYEQIPKNMVNAFLAAEDSTFFQHSGISIKGIGRALTEAVSEDEGQTGGSTITMQVAKNYFLSSERTLNRKLTELFLARKIEEQLTKDEILTLYVNKIYLGEGAYGVKAAAKQYYSKSLENLTIAETAMIAGLPKAPGKYNPVLNPKRSLERRDWILGQMLKYGTITKAEYETAIAEPINLRPYQAKLDMNLPYLAEMARVSLVEQYGESVMDSGWRVRLTLNSETQQIAETALKKGLMQYDKRHGWRRPANTKDKENPVKLENFPDIPPFYPMEVKKVGNVLIGNLKDGTEVKASSYGGIRANDVVYITPNEDKTQWTSVQLPAVEGSLVSLNPDTGALLAVAGGFDFNKSKFNRGTQGYRQPGSTIKPLVYLAALEKGFSPDTLISDGKLQVGSWVPKNADGRYLGMMPLKTGLVLSRNLVSIRVLRSAGIQDTRELLGHFGLEKERMPSTLSLALGSGEATPVQMATAYATIVNGGHRIQPYFIEQIYDYNNKLLYQANPAQACAICFNNQLKKLNEKLLTDYQKAQKEQAENQEKDKKSDNAITDEKSKDTDTQQAKKQTKDKKSQKTDETEAEKQQRLAEAQEKLYDATFEKDRLKAPVVQYVKANQAPRIISSANAFQMANILRDVIMQGTAKKARAMGRSDVGGKTGTTNQAKDAWFAGIHPTMSTVVWVGFDQPKGLGKGEFGGVSALPIWMDFTSKMLKGKPVEWVSVNNRAKSKKQEQEIIEQTDNGERRVDSNGKEITDDKAKNSTQIAKPVPNPRPVPEPEPEQKPNTNMAQVKTNSPVNAN